MSDNSEKILKQKLEEVQKLNEKIRGVMNDLQEKEQVLLDSKNELSLAKKELEERNREIDADKNRLKTILEQMGEGVVVLTPDFKVEIINDRASELLKYDAEKRNFGSKQGKAFMDVCHEMGESKAFFRKREINIEGVKPVILQITLSKLISNDKSQGFVVIIRDITLERQIEQMKTDFVANVAHEVRTPMATMKEAVNMLFDGIVGTVNEKQKKYIGIIDSNITRLLRMVNDLLDLSKIEAGSMKLNSEKIDICILLKDVVDSLTPVAEKSSIELSYSIKIEKLFVMCDKDRIIQVLYNLIMNAIKFTPSGGNIKVGCEEHMAGALVSVADTGPGLTQEEIEIVFNRFKQLDSPHRIKGTGLGLAISKAFIEMHGGQIWLESEKGKGSVFKFVIPLAVE